MNKLKIYLSEAFSLQAEYDPDTSKWLSKSQNKFTSPVMENEIMVITSLKIAKDISEQISGKW